MGKAGHRTAKGEGMAGPIRKLRNNNRKSLGPEWSMSKVGTPPPHNLDKLHGLVATIKNNNINEDVPIISVRNNVFDRFAKSDLIYQIMIH